MFGRVFYAVEASIGYFANLKYHTTICVNVTFDISNHSAVLPDECWDYYACMRWNFLPLPRFSLKRHYSYRCNRLYFFFIYNKSFSDEKYAQCFEVIRCG